MKKILILFGILAFVVLFGFSTYYVAKNFIVEEPLEEMNYEYFLTLEDFKPYLSEDTEIVEGELLGVKRKWIIGLEEMECTYDGYPYIWTLITKETTASEAKTSMAISWKASKTIRELSGSFQEIPFKKPLGDSVRFGSYEDEEGYLGNLIMIRKGSILYELEVYGFQLQDQSIWTQLLKNKIDRIRF